MLFLMYLIPLNLSEFQSACQSERVPCWPRARVCVGSNSNSFVGL